MRKITLFFVIFAGAVLLLQCTAQAAPPKLVLLDTDIASDIDDVGALSLLNYDQSQGKCQILAVIVDQKLGSSADACKAIDSYWQHSQIPVGQIETPNALSDYSPYTLTLSAGILGPRPKTEDSTELYRRVLEAASAASVTIICIGNETAFDKLLMSPPGKDSPMSGADLVSKKVKAVVVMGGDYSLSPNTSGRSPNPEFNLATDAKSSADMMEQLNALHVPTYFIGFSMGGQITIGDTTGSLPYNSPLRESYLIYNGNKARSAWDVVAADFAVDGAGADFALTSGANAVDPSDGMNTFTVDGKGSQYYLTFKSNAATVISELNALYMETPD